MIRSRYMLLAVLVLLLAWAPAMSSALLTDSATVGGNGFSSGTFDPSTYASYYLHENPTPPAGDVPTTLTNTATKTAYVTVDAPTAPSAEFVASVTSGFAPLSVTFSDLSTGAPTAWSWTFGDSGTSTAQTPTHSYATPGTYTVTLTASNATGSNLRTRSAYIVVAPGSPLTKYASSNTPIAGGGWGNPTNAYADDNVDASMLTPKNTTFTTGFGGFDFSAIPAGSTINSVSLEVEWFATSSQEKFSAQAYVGGTARGTALSLPSAPTTRTLSTHGNTGLTTLADLNAAVIRVTATRGNPGPNNITSSLDHVRLVVAFTPPNAGSAPGATFSATPTSGTHPLAVTFSDGSSGSPTTWGWDFNNDGLVDSRSQNPVYTYPAPGTYSVRLVAANASGAAAFTRTNYVTVSAPGIPGTANTAEFYGSPIRGTASFNVSFTDRSSSSPTSWSWDFGDGGTSSVQNPSHNYSTPGTYAVSLTAGWGSNKPLSATSTAPSAATLYRYSTDYDTGLGRLLEPGGSGASETDTDQAVWWSTPTYGSSTVIGGNVLIRTYSQLSGAGSLTAYLRDYNPGTNSYTEIGNVNLTRASWDDGAGGFVQHDLILHLANYTVAAGHALQLKLVSASSADMRVAYDTTVYPALLRIPTPWVQSVVYRINNGGAQVTANDGGPNWAADSSGAPSSYYNSGASGNTTYSTPNSITLDGTVPASAPASLFSDERYDAPAAAEMAWGFPVSNGNYEVRLYFAEIYSGITGPGQRVFDVSVEGALVLDDFDQRSDTGGLDIGTMRSFTTTVSDGTLNIDFTHVVENPAIKAIEILTAP